MVMRHPEDQAGVRAKKVDRCTAEQSYANALLFDLAHATRTLTTKQYVLFLERHFDSRGRRRAEPANVGLQIPDEQLAALDATIVAHFERVGTIDEEGEQ
jgi:hypothetical protein